MSKAKTFKKLVDDYLATLTEPSPGLPEGFTREFFCENRHLSYERIADTKYGKVGVSCHPEQRRNGLGWISGWLPPPPDGRPMQQSFIGGTYRNDYTGKWNWHFHDNMTPEEAFEQFRAGFESILVRR